MECPDSKGIETHVADGNDGAAVDAGEHGIVVNSDPDR